MTNVITKHVKHTNAVDQDESIFQMYDKGVEDEIIAQAWGLSIGYIKGSYKTKWRKARGTARTSPVRGVIRNVVTKKIEVIKVEHSNFNVEKINKLKGDSKILYLVIGGEKGQKYPVISIEPKSVSIWDSGRDKLFDEVVISIEEFKKGKYYFSKK